MAFILAVMAAEIPTAQATPPAAVDFTWLFLKMLFLLGAISMVAILLLKYGAPRIPMFRRMASYGFAKILARQALEHRKGLYLIKIGKRYLVIGSSDHAITPITELSEEEVKALEIETEGGRK